MFIVTKHIDSDNISKVCRTCLREDGDKMICLFVGPAGTSLAAKLRSLSCLEVWQGDGLPEKLCDRCVTRAESALLFREQCRAADKALRQAALKVSGLTTCTPVAGCKLYEHPDQEVNYTIPMQNSLKTWKCVECGAVFMDYQELCAHSRLHGPFIQESAQHMHIVESHDTLYPPDSTITRADIDNDDNNSIAQKSDRPACALYCSLCNHTFPDRIQLISHNFSHCSDNSIELGDDSNENAESSSFPQTVNSSYSRNTSNQEAVPATTYRDDLSLSQENAQVRMSNIVRKDISSQNDSIINNTILRFSRFSEDRVQGSSEEHVNHICNNKAPIKLQDCQSQKKYKCEICGKLFAQKSKLTIHEFSHTGERPFKCRSCDKAYTSNSKLNAHMRLHTSTSVYQCNICKKNFSYPSYLLEHAKVHEKNHKKIDPSLKLKKYECSTCNKKFRLKKNFKAHVKFHSGRGLFYCEICDKPFSQKYNLQVHLRTHNGMRIHKCEYCDKSFIEKGNYTEHLRVHTKVKPFICKLCGKAFSQSSHLKNHEASHNSIRPHSCQLCGKRFKLLSHLKRHTNLHSAFKSFQCTQCDQMFSEAFSLKRHMKRHSDANT